MAALTHTPLVSVIVIFLNEERFLEEAIESVFAQTYANWELLLCDDGSTDGSTRVAHSYVARFPERVRYLEHPGHENRGMSATRNLGLRHAKGEFVSWLDGDDVWMPQKLQRQVEILMEYPEAAMVYGRLYMWHGWTGDAADQRKNYLQELGSSADTLIRPPELLKLFLLDDLHTPSGVLVRRSVLDEVGGYDEAFRGMHEDGIVHAKICLRWPVFASGESWYKYRQHPESTCNKAIAAGEDRLALGRYLAWVENYLSDQGQRGSEVWKIVRRLMRENEHSKRPAADKRDSVQMHLRKVREIADGVVPAIVRRWFGLVAFGGRQRPPSGWIHLGNLNRVTPVSSQFGFDRGTPIDRYYIERFLAARSTDIRGRVLEVENSNYTTRFGGKAVTRSDVLHVREGNPDATIVGDLTTGEGIPQEAFDCIILTQVLPFLWDFQSAIRYSVRALKKDGVLLVTLPGISQISRYDADQWGDFWRFTSMSARRLFENAFGRESVRVSTFGNVLAATAFLHGLAAQEVSEEDLGFHDPDYEVTITVRAVKMDSAPSARVDSA